MHSDKRALIIETSQKGMVMIAALRFHPRMILNSP